MEILDYLFIGAHPDDCEISCGGTILALKDQGFKIGVVDLTEGENGTYGSLEDRNREKDLASKKLGLDYRSCLRIPDGRIELNQDYKMRVVNEIRKLKPKMVVSFKPPTRHPDHFYTAELVKQSVFLSGLPRYRDKGALPDSLDGFQKLTGHAMPTDFIRPELICFEEPVAQLSSPDFVIDISNYFERKVEVIKCFSSQVKTDETSSDEGVETLIKSSRFWQMLRSKNIWYGSLIDRDYGEGFFTESTLEIVNPLDHFKKKLR